MTLLVALSLSAHAKPQNPLKALTSAFDPANGARASLSAFRTQMGAMGADGPIAFSTAVSQVLPMFQGEEREALITEAKGHLDAAASTYPDRAHDLLAAKGVLLVAAGDGAAGEAALRESLAKKPNMTALSALLDRHPGEAGTLCPQSRASMDLTALMDVCAGHGDSLAWVSPKELSDWRADQQQRAMAAAQRAAQDQARLEAMFSTPAASAPAPSSASAGAPAPSSAPTSVTIHSNCKSTVRVFFGDKPKYSSGTTTTISSNSVSSYSLRPGSMIWIVDGSDNPLSSTSVGSSSQRIEISPGCTGFGAY